MYMCVCVEGQEIALDDRWIMESEKNGGESWETSWESIGVIQLREEGGTGSLLIFITNIKFLYPKMTTASRKP